MSARFDDISTIIKGQIEKFKGLVEVSQVGVVVVTGDGVALVYGLDQAMMGELLEFDSGVMGMVLNLSEDTVGAIILGSQEKIKEGDRVKCTGRIASVPVGEKLLGRVINPLGEALDGGPEIKTDKLRNLEYNAPSVIERQPVKEPLQTGIKAIDSMIPIGRGQRELIIGDRQTGKTAVAMDAVLNQKGKNVQCIYVSIGQKMSTVAQMQKIFTEHGAMAYTTIVVAAPDDPPSLLYLAPYAGCAMGEEFLYNGKHALVIYDDLSKHATAYRQLSLLLRRPPGREAYPGDVFYLHARLLERAAKLSEEKGGGSLTALPIIETQAGDVSAYIPTNVISITDGQIYLESELFFAGVRPAVNVGISVSRVGGAAQIKAMKKVAGHLRLDMAQYRELQSFAQFTTEVDKATMDQLRRGERLVEILKQDQYVPMEVAEQICIIYAGVKGLLDDIEKDKIKEFEASFLKYLADKHPKVIASIEQTKDLTQEAEAELIKAIGEYKALA